MFQSQPANKTSKRNSTKHSVLKNQYKTVKNGAARKGGLTEKETLTQKTDEANSADENAEDENDDEDD